MYGWEGLDGPRTFHGHQRVSRVLSVSSPPQSGVESLGPYPRDVSVSSVPHSPEQSVWWGRWDRHRWVVISLLALLTRLAVLLSVGTTLTQVRRVTV